MSVDMYVSASKNQAKSVSGMTKQQTTGYEELQKAIADFTLNSPFLTGKAYDTSKAFFSTVLYPLAQGGILLSEAVDKAVTKFPQDYQSQVDSGNLKQSDLEEKIRQADRLIEQAEGIRTMLESSLTPDIIKSSQLAANLRLLESYSGVKRILEEKLDKLMTFNHNSPRIFEEIQALEDAIDQGLAQTTTAFNPATGTFTIPNKGALSWSKTIQEKWSTRDEDEQQRIKEKIEKENLPTTKAEILRDYHWSTNSNMYVNNKTGIPSPEVTGLYNMFVQAEHTSQKNPQLEFFNEMLRTGKHPTTGVKITEAERANAVLMLYTLALQPFVGAWAMSKIPQSAESVSEVKKTESNINWEAKQPVSG
ncbi:MAG: T7SS effector LXG polymorphic toxin, partial [Carnobacterium sp.]